MNPQAVVQTIENIRIKNDSKCIEANLENFEHLINTSPILVIDFWAPWCKPCLKVGKIIEELARKYSDDISFAKLNTDLYPNLSDQFEIFTIPYFRVYKKGIFVGHFSGNVSKKKLLQALEKVKELKV